MPIYEFYCKRCNTIYNFFSRTINTEKTPNCPKCKTEVLDRQISIFAVTGKASGTADMDDLPLDEAKMEQAMKMLAKESENVNEDDPGQAAHLMRKLTDAAGLRMSEGVEEALDRMEKGDDPDQIGMEMGDLLEQEDPFTLPGKKAGAGSRSKPAPHVDETLYDL